MPHLWRSFVLDWQVATPLPTAPGTDLISSRSQDIQLRIRIIEYLSKALEHIPARNSPRSSVSYRNVCKRSIYDPRNHAKQEEFRVCSCEFVDRFWCRPRTGLRRCESG